MTEPEQLIEPQRAEAAGMLRVPILAGFNAVAMLFWSAVVNGMLAPPLIVLVVLLTSDPAIMGRRVNSPILRRLGWGAALTMTLAALAMLATAGS